MSALASALRDKKTRDALEADFRQYYSLDLRDLWRGGLNFIQVARLMTQLPRDGRLYREASKEPLSLEEHLRMSILDAVRTGSYYSMVAAQAAVGKKGWGAVVKNAPKPLKRRPEDDQKVVVTVKSRDAKQAVSRMIQSKIAMRMVG